ncbi:MAG TPA: hypothetical protein VMZ29_15130 [Candidatus Bathyarchaeia archaeon]|nr:hypothetical protein [Candidatus Bathyarchaeia archaeon]
MSDNRDSQSLTSKIIKILRITNEPLSAHAINELYGLPYKKVQEILLQLEDEQLVLSLKTKRGIFYFIPDKYLKRHHDIIESDEVLPYLWYEELSEEELKSRKENIVKALTKLKNKFSQKEISASIYFSNLQKKNEELSIITQIIEARKEKKIKYCYYCETEIPLDVIICPNCNKELPKCSVCKRLISAKESVIRCPYCESVAHESHLREWVKTIGTCPICKHELIESKLNL